METLIDDFLDYLRYERYRSEKTVESYGADLLAFVHFVKGADSELKWDSVDADVVRNWMESMMDNGNAATSINRRLSALRTFYKYAMARNLVRTSPVCHIKGPKKTKPLPQYLHEDQMDRLLDVENWGEDFVSVRDRTILLVFYSTGVRLSELVGLDDESIDYLQGQLKVLGKRNKERIIPFGDELKRNLQRYQKIRNDVFGTCRGALFVSGTGCRIKDSQVSFLVKKHLSKVSTQKKRSPHVLRHTFATVMLNNDSDIQSVQKLLGHESLVTTEIYTHTTFEQLREAYQKAHPRCKEED